MIAAPLATTRNLQLLSAFCLAICQTWTAFAQTASGENAQEKLIDTFRYAPVPAKSIDVWNLPKSSEIAGTIDELDEKHVVYRDDIKSHDLPSNRVFQVATTWRTTAAVEAHALFSQRRYREAKEAIPKAAKNDLPRWQQRIMVAEFVDTLVALGDTRVAGSVYLTSLAAHQPPAMLYAHMPLNWTNIEPDRLLFESAVEWLGREDEAAQLLGASWLLFGAEHESAKATLTKLQSTKREPIASLAIAQSWRLVPPPDTDAKLSSWLEYRDRMLHPLQLGPTMFIADRLSRINKHELAVGLWARVATVHSDRPHHVFMSLAAAARHLKQQGMAEESERFKKLAEEFAPK